MNSPQRPPVVKGIAVSVELINWILSTTCTATTAEKKEVALLVSDRCEYGLKKYGQMLMTQDGRDDVVDAMQEAGDLLQYAYKAKLNGRKEELVKTLAPTLKVLNELLAEK